MILAAEGKVEYTSSQIKKKGSKTVQTQSSFLSISILYSFCYDVDFLPWERLVFLFDIQQESGEWSFKSQTSRLYSPEPPQLGAPLGKALGRIPRLARGMRKREETYVSSVTRNHPCRLRLCLRVRP